MSAIDEVKQKTDIVEAIGQYTKLVKSGRTFRGLCPFHSEKRPSFFVYPEQQSWHCFGACNTGGDVFSFVMKKEGTDFGEALRLLAERAGVTLPSRSAPDVRKDKKERLFKINEVATQYFHNLLLNSPAAARARDYVAGRGLSPEAIAGFRLGFSLNKWESLKQYLIDTGFSENVLLEAGLIIATDEGKTHDRFRNRLMFPISDARGRITGFGARALDDSLPKYLNSPQTPVFDKSGSLYAINLATPAIRQQKLAVIVEGYMDVITAHQHGFTNVVAAMGIAVNEKQISKLKELAVNNIALSLDADAAGKDAMLQLIRYRNTFDANLKIIKLPAGKDPDDVIKEDIKIWQSLIDEALPVSDTDGAFDLVISGLDMSDPEDKSKAANELLPIIAAISDSVKQMHYIDRLANLVGETRRRIEASINRIMPRIRTSVPYPQLATREAKSFRSNPLEEYCLTLLLQNPLLKKQNVDILPEYFESSVNREIFIAWQQTDDFSSLKDGLDMAIWEYLDTLANRNIPASQIELKYTDCARNLRRKYLQNLEAKRAEIFALEAESGGSGADLAKLQEEGIEPSIQLKEIDRARNKSGVETRR